MVEKVISSLFNPMANLLPTTLPAPAPSPSSSSPLPTLIRIPSEVLEFHKECPWYDSVCWKIPPTKASSTTGETSAENDFENNNNSSLTVPMVSSSGSNTSSWSQEAGVTTSTLLLSQNETDINLSADVSIFTTDHCYRVVIFVPNNHTNSSSSTSSSLNIDNLDGIYSQLAAQMNADNSTTVIKNNGREIFDTTETSTSAPQSPSPSQPSAIRYFEVGGRRYAYDYVDSGECMCRFSTGSKALVGVFGAVAGLVFVAVLIAIVIKVRRALGEKEAADSAVLSRWATRRDARKAAAQRRKDQLTSHDGNYSSNSRVNGARSDALENTDQAGLTADGVPTAATTQHSQYRYSQEEGEEDRGDIMEEETGSMRISIRAHSLTEEDGQPPADTFILPFEDDGGAVIEGHHESDSENPDIPPTEQQPLTLFTHKEENGVSVRFTLPPMVPSEAYRHACFPMDNDERSASFAARARQAAASIRGAPRPPPPLPPHFYPDPTTSPNSSIYSATTGQADDGVSGAEASEGVVVDSPTTNGQSHTSGRRPSLLPPPSSTPQHRHHSSRTRASSATNILLPHNRHLSVSPLTEEQRRLASYVRQIRRCEHSSNHHSALIRKGLSPSLGSIERNRSRSAPRI